MIRVEYRDPPADFDRHFLDLGEGALLELIGDPAAPRRPGPRRAAVATRIEDIPVKKLPEHWTSALPALRQVYADTCAYLGMHIHPATGAATVDHFKPRQRHQRLAYTWSNFRLAAQLVNTFKDTHEDVLDPFTIMDGWFRLNVGNFEVLPDPELAERDRLSVDLTIRRLRLNEPVFRGAREAYHDRYHGLGDYPEPSPLSLLVKEAPFVAKELARQGRLRPGDSLRFTAVDAR